MFNRIKLLLTLNRAAGQYETISKEIDTMPAKSLFLSRTFWFNVLTFSGTVAGILPAKWAAVAVPVVNIGLRVITGQAVTFNIPFKD